MEAALSYDDITSELAGLRDPLDRALGWAGVLVLLALLLPVAKEGDGGVWYWHLLVHGEGYAPLFAHLAAGVALLTLARSRRPKLDKSLAALCLGVAATWIILGHALSRTDLLILFPRPFVAGALLFYVGVGLSGAAIAWRSGPFAEQRPRGVSLILALAGVVAAALFVGLPHPEGTLLGSAFSAQHHLPMITSAMLTLLPIAVALFGLQASLQRTEDKNSAVGWTLGIPIAVIVTLGFKGALTYGNELLLLLALRTALLVGALLLVLTFSIVGGLSQLYDRLGAEATRPTLLLRDVLLFRALERAGRSGPRLARSTEGYRNTVVRLVRGRFKSLLHDVRAEHPPPQSQIDLLDRMRRHLLDDRDPFVHRPPQVSPLIDWLGRRRNLELGIVLAGVTFMAMLGGAQLAMIPVATEWPIDQEQAWMRELYEKQLPLIGVAAGGTHYPGRNGRIRRTVEKAAELAAPVPELAESIRKLTPMVIGLPDHRRSIESVTEQINRTARENGVPFYLDTDVVATRRRRAYLHFFYVKSYRIERVRHARDGLAEYTALWVKRADGTNIVDGRLGWTRHDEQHGMILLDVVREYWTDDVAPALAGEPYGEAQKIYAAHAPLLRDDLARAVARLNEIELLRAKVLIRARLKCIRYEESCPRLTKMVDDAVVEIFARKVEAHELQHVIDGRGVRHPEPLRKLMATYSEEAMTFAAAELSAYLAEVARSDQPRLALVHFFALAAVRPLSPEGFAGRIAVDRLALLGEDAHELLELPEAELRARAAEAHAELFGSDLQAFILRDGSDPS